MSARYDLIIVGTEFAGTFFLMRYLEGAPATVRVLVLVLERGGSDDKAWQLANRPPLQHRPGTGVPQPDAGQTVVHEPGLRRQFQVLARRHDPHDAGGFSAQVALRRRPRLADVLR